MEESNMQIVEVERRRREKYKAKYLTAKGWAVAFGVLFAISAMMVFWLLRGNITLQREVALYEKGNMKLVVVK